MIHTKHVPVKIFETCCCHQIRNKPICFHKRVKGINLSIFYVFYVQLWVENANRSIMFFWESSLSEHPKLAFKNIFPLSSHYLPVWQRSSGASWSLPAWTADTLMLRPAPWNADTSWPETSAGWSWPRTAVFQASRAPSAHSWTWTRGHIIKRCMMTVLCQKVTGDSGWGGGGCSEVNTLTWWCTTAPLPLGIWASALWSESCSSRPLDRKFHRWGFGRVPWSRSCICRNWSSSWLVSAA